MHESSGRSGPEVIRTLPSLVTDQTLTTQFHNCFSSKFIYRIRKHTGAGQGHICGSHREENLDTQILWITALLVERTTARSKMPQKCEIGFRIRVQDWIKLRFCGPHYIDWHLTFVVVFDFHGEQAPDLLNSLIFICARSLPGCFYVLGPVKMKADLTVQK